MEAFSAVALVAMLVETLVQVIKAWPPEGARVPAWLWPVVSALLGMVVCVLANVDAFSLLGITLSAPIVGCVLTGILVSRGASFVHDVWDNVRAAKGEAPDQAA